MAAPSVYLNSPGSGIPTFSTLSGESTRWKSFISGFGLQTALVVAAATLTISAAPEIVQQSYNHIELVPPPLVQTETYKTPKVTAVPTPRIVVPTRVQLEKISPPPVAIAVKQEIKPVLPQTIARMPEAPAPKFESTVVDRPAGPKVARAIESANFGGSSAIPTLKNTPAHEVQTGGFGDPNGVPANANATGKANIAKLGSFELPGGPGQGNGSGGSRGLRGTVASAGFGNGVATEGGGGGRGTGAQGRVQSTAFASAEPPVAEAPRRKAIAETAATTPVSITSKPNPTYTDEARKLHVEGEVLVQVTFTAQGQVRVLRVIRGLGHGLDEAAVRAAEGIRFSPAQREGAPVDSNATLHIVFQLS